MRRVPRLQFDVIEAALLVVGVIVFSSLISVYGTLRHLQPYISTEAEELKPLETTYASRRNSEHAEEWIVRDFFQDFRGGVFVDVGANDYKRFSNTYYLETTLGWTGVAIEPQTKFASAYARYRPRTKFVPLFVSDRSNQQATLYVPPNDLVASSSQQFAQRSAGGRADTIPVPTSTLDDILDRARITKVDFLTMDIELAEPEALAGFSIARFEPRLICVEAHLPVRQQILDYFARSGYVLIGKYLRADSHNLWFTPLTSGAHPSASPD